MLHEVIDRTRFETHYCSAGYDEDAKVNLVGHSMGGLIIAGRLERVGTKALIKVMITGRSSLDGDPDPRLSRSRGAAAA